MNYSKLLASSALATIVLMPVAAFAQEAAADDADTSEIVVTATRREQRVQDIPYNISAIGGDAIEANKTRDSTELLRTIPGLSVVDRGARNSGVLNSLTIRGINVNSTFLGDYAVSGVAPVSTYVNDTPLFAGYLLKDLERVEVLRGPQGTLYGSGSLGGTVRYILKKPELGKTGGSVSAGLSHVNGSDSVGYDADLIANFAFGDNLAIRAVVSRQDYPGITDYVNLYVLDASGAPAAPAGILASNASYYSKKDADTVEVWYGRIGVRWQPSDAVDLNLTYNHQEDKIGGRRQVTRGFDGYGNAYSGYQNGSIQLEPSSRNVDSLSLEATIDLGFATLTSSTSWYDHNGESVSENTGFYAKAGFLPYYYNYPRPMASAVRTYGDKSFIQEFRLVSDQGGVFDYVLGGYYQHQKLKSGQDSYLRGFKRWWDAWAPSAASAVTGDSDFYYRRSETFEEFALFGELTWHMASNIDLTVGARQFWQTSDNVTDIDLPLYASLAQPTRAVFSTKDNDILFKGNLSWRFDDRGMVYATVSEGYRRGGSNAVPLTGNFAESPAWQTYTPDTVINYEVGIKGGSRGFSYNVDAFYIDWKDIQLNTATPFWGFYVTQNGNSARSQGIEAQIEGQTGGFHYGLGYTYVDAKLTSDFFRPDVPTAKIASKGTRLPGSARHVITGNASYTFETGADSDLTMRADAYYQSSSENSISSSARYNRTLPGFSIWNASATWRSGRFSVTAYVKNIFNNDGVTGAFTEAHMGTAPSEGYYGNGSKDFISQPRTIGLATTFNF
ncbi:TonB-dependent receptor [Novosphingobium sp.]|uniref:TonB-dependent receptor n=1 Tax=Novosphingobium sp. TaxID=1874826 RepID=UPI0035AFF99F